jgi:hypothetical protein
MKQLLLTSLCLALLSGAAWSQEQREGAPPPTPKPPAPQPVPPAQTPAPVPCHCGPKLKEHQILIVPIECATALIWATVWPEEMVVTECALEVTWQPQEQTVMELVTKPKPIKQTIMCSRLEKKEVVDPCSGCKKTIYCEVQEPQTVEVNLYECVTEPRTVVVKVPCLKKVEKKVLVTRYHVTLTKQPGIATRYTMGELKQELLVPTCPPQCPAPTVVPAPTPCNCHK